MENKKTYMGVDQSLSSTGICIGDGVSALEYLDYFSTKKISDEELADIKRVKEISEHIVKLAKEYKVSHIYLEAISYGSTGRATRQLAGLLFVMASDLIDEGFDVHIVPPTSLKKFATGKGNSGKDVMMSSLPKNILDEVNKVKKSSRDDLTDAYWLMRYAYEEQKEAG